MLQLTTILFLISFSTLAGLHILATKLFLYWRYLWLDIPMHAFGGVVITLGLFTLRDLGLFPNKFLRFIPVFLIVLFIVLFWEVWEVWMSLVDTSIMRDYIIDASIDVAMGLLGGICGFFIGNSLRKLR
jgi:hypothetical protein